MVGDAVKPRTEKDDHNGQHQGREIQRGQDRRMTKVSGVAGETGAIVDGAGASLNDDCGPLLVVFRRVAERFRSKRVTLSERYR